MSSVFPTVVEEEGSGKKILKIPESYKKLDSGILFEDIQSGTEGISINSANQQVTISYQHFQQDAKLIHRGYFKLSLSDFADEFDFKADFTEAMLGMKITGYRRLIIPPQINKTSEYTILDVILENIKSKESSRRTKTETVEEENNNPKVESKEEKSVSHSKNNVGSIIAATIGAAPVIFQIIREILFSFSNSDVTSEPLPPNQWTRVGPKIMYQVIDGGEGEVLITRYQQGCFEYKESGSAEARTFQGSPTELAKNLGPGFDDAILEVIVGMKLNERRVIFIPAGLSSSGENTFLDLKLTTIGDLNPRSRI